jgi:dTDP-L-rhamnose 4-epimerase
VNSVLISGGAGFIGSGLAKYLLARGYRVAVLDNLSSQIHGTAEVHADIPGVSFVKGDVRSREDWLRALSGQQLVVHLAAETGTGQSMYQADRYMDVNVRGTAILLDILANERHSVKKILVASSRAIYGEGKYTCAAHGVVYPGPRNGADLSVGDFIVKCPVCNAPATPMATDEESKIHPISVYGISKHAQEQLFLTVGRALNIPAVALRYQNVYGPGQSLKNPYTGILSIFSTRLRNGAPVSVFEDGRETRDFVFIDDVVEATRRALESDAADFDVFNVGSGVRTDVLTVASSLRDALGCEGRLVVSGHFRIGDIRDNFADISKIATRLGFRPRVGFAEGIRRFADWVATQIVPADLFEQSIEEMQRRGLYR